MIDIRPPSLEWFIPARGSRRANSRPPRRRLALGSNIEGLEERYLLTQTRLRDAIPLGSLSQAISMIGEIKAYDHPDLYSFTAEAGETVQIDIDDPALTGNFNIELFAPGRDTTGNFVADRIDTDPLEFGTNPDKPPEEMHDKGPYLEDKLHITGTYYILVGTGRPNESNSAIYSGKYDFVVYQNSHVPAPYTLHVQAKDETPPPDPHSTIKTAVAYGTFGKAVHGRIEIGTDVDMYKLYATSGQSLSFELTSPTAGDGALRLFDASGKPLANDDRGAGPDHPKGLFASGYLEYNFSRPGTYYVGVSSSDNRSYDPKSEKGRTAGGTATYTLQITDIDTFADPGSTISAKTPTFPEAAFKQGYSGVIERSTDVDLFKIRGIKGKRVAFTVDAGLPSSAPRSEVPVLTIVRLFDQEGHQVAVSRQVQQKVISDRSVLVHTFEKTETYYVGISWVDNNVYVPTRGIHRRGLFLARDGSGRERYYAARYFPGTYHIKVATF